MTYSFVWTTLLHVLQCFAYLHYTSYLDNSANDWKIMPKGQTQKIQIEGTAEEIVEESNLPPAHPNAFEI